MPGHFEMSLTAYLTMTDPCPFVRISALVFNMASPSPKALYGDPEMVEGYGSEVCYLISSRIRNLLVHKD